MIHFGTFKKKINTNSLPSIIYDQKLIMNKERTQEVPLVLKAGNQIMKQAFGMQKTNVKSNKLASTFYEMKFVETT